MSDANKSFFSGLHVAITGMAALVTSIVAVLGLALNQGWIGGHSKPAASGTTTPGAATSIPGDTSTSVGTSGSTIFGSGTSDSVPPRLNVEPPAIDFQPFAQTDQTVTVRNPGNAPITLQAPFVDGIDKARFSVTDAGCSGTLESGRSCQVRVTFIRAAGTFTARLVIQIVGGAAVEAPITAKAIL